MRAASGTECLFPGGLDRDSAASLGDQVQQCSCVDTGRSRGADYQCLGDRGSTHCWSFQFLIVSLVLEEVDGEVSA